MLGLTTRIFCHILRIKGCLSSEKPFPGTPIIGILFPASHFSWPHIPITILRTHVEDPISLPSTGHVLLRPLTKYRQMSHKTRRYPRTSDALAQAFHTKPCFSSAWSNLQFRSITRLQHNSLGTTLPRRKDQLRKNICKLCRDIVHVFIRRNGRSRLRLA
jgi:hypothetical protein